MVKFLQSYIILLTINIQKNISKQNTFKHFNLINEVVSITAFHIYNKKSLSSQIL